MIAPQAAFQQPAKGSSERISASFSAWVSLLRSISGATPMLNRVARDRVNHRRDHRATHAADGKAATGVSNYFHPQGLALQPFACVQHIQ